MQMQAHLRKNLREQKNKEKDKFINKFYFYVINNKCFHLM